MGSPVSSRSAGGFASTAATSSRWPRTIGRGLGSAGPGSHWSCSTTSPSRTTCAWPPNVRASEGSSPTSSTPLGAVVTSAHALDVLGIAELGKRMPDELSAGQRKLVGAARAVAGRPRMLLMDEPAAGLDTAESREFAGRLRAVRDAGITVLLVDHDMGLVLDVCDYIYVIDFGVKIAEGTPARSPAISAWLSRISALPAPTAGSNDGRPTAHGKRPVDRVRRRAGRPRPRLERRCRRDRRPARGQRRRQDVDIAVRVGDQPDPRRRRRAVRLVDPRPPPTLSPAAASPTYSRTARCSSSSPSARTCASGQRTGPPICPVRSSTSRAGADRRPPGRAAVGR